MILLDENIRKEEREKLQKFKFRVNQIGHKFTLQGLDDIEQIIPLLHQLKSVTFFTHDRDFYKQHYIHKRYALVYLDVAGYLSAAYIRRLLKHKRFDATTKRLGKVIRLAPDGIHFWTIETAMRQFEDW